MPDVLSVGDAAAGDAWGVLGLTSHVAHWGPQGQAGYDAEGHALNYSYSALNASTSAWTETDYTVNYLKKDGYLEKATHGTSNDPLVLASTDTSYYDAFGRRIDIVSHSAGQSTDRVRAFAYDAEGEILQRRDGSASGSTFTVTDNGGYAINHYAYVEGQQIGNVNEHGDIHVLGGVTGFSNTEQGTSNYVAQAGDTMQSIAQQVYGDASLWYVVAGANGFDAASDAPAAGQTLKLPEVQTNSNTAETFKPYNPREISGSSMPSLPQAPQPPPSAQHCSTLAEIVVIAVVIVVSIYTAGAAAEAFGAADTAIGTSAVSASTFATGASVMAGGGASLGLTAGEAFAAAAAGGAAGSAAGQLVGDAEGIHQGFSWGEVAGAGLGAGITAGLAGEISGGQTIAQLHDAGGIANDARIAGIGAAGAIGSYAGEKLVGQPAHFNWANVAAAAIGTEATTALGLNSTLAQKWGQATGGSFAGNLVGGLVNGAIDSEAARLLGGDAANGRQIAEDAFGNALGNAAVAGIERENAISERKQARSTSSLLAADNPNSQVNPVAAFLSGPYADTGEYADAMADYDPFNGPLLASSDRASMLAGVYGPAGYSLTADQSADVRSMQSDAPWLDSGEWSSNNFQSYIDANGDVNVIGNPVYDASGMPVMENGQQVVIVPAGASVTPSAEELAQLRAVSSGALPPVGNWYTPRVGYFENAYNYYMAGVADSHASVGKQAWNLVEALATVPLALPDMAISSVYNAGNEAALAGQKFARGTLLSGSNSTLAYLHGGQDLLNGFLGFGSAAAGGSSLIRSAGDSAVFAPAQIFDPERPNVVGDTASGIGPGRITVYRVEGSPNQRLIIDDLGNVSIASGNNSTIWLNFGEAGRATDYFSTKVAQGLPEAQLRSFEIDPAFLDQVQNQAVPEQFARSFPDRPIISADPFPNQFGIRQNQFQQLLDSIYQGSGKNVPSGGN